jgi:peptidoglycan/LPS O-acetylase OafA/YrhL
MLSAKRILWTLWAMLGVIGLLTFAGVPLDNVHEGPDRAVIACIVGALAIAGNRNLRGRWRSLPRVHLALLALGWYAILVATIVFENRKMQMAARFDVEICASIPIVGALLLALYLLFSRGMDTLWRRVTGR